METKTAMIAALVGIVLLVSVVQAIQIFSLQSTISTSGLVTAKTGSSSGQIDMTGWTDNEKMNYDMHGVIPARLGSSAASSSAPTMVGGC